MQLRKLALLPALVLALAAAGATADDKVGTVRFETSCSPAVQAEFERAVAMLHSFWFSASTDAFIAIAQKDPGCAKAVGAKTQRERDYVGALETFYRDADKVEHRTRALAYRQAMEQLAARYPNDREASIFYALALNATSSPMDKTYADQLKAAAILEKVFAEQPQHPGVAHYLIHSYDYPPIAEKGLPAARRYAGIAPDAAHALHMPSHIFTRVGAWEDSLATNQRSEQ